jgi:hypothetical protein
LALFIRPGISLPQSELLHKGLPNSIKTYEHVILTSDPPLKEAVLGVFDLAEIVAWGSKNKRIDEFCAKFFAKSISKNRNHLAFVVWEIFKKKTERG